MLTCAKMGNEDLGKHFEKTGALVEAAEAFGRMRHDVSTLKHIMDCTRHLIEVAIQRREWATVLTNANKALSMREHEEEKAMRPYLHLSVGIASLGQGKFSEAAESFLHVDLVQSYEWIAAPSDIAMYGGLLALATMDRKQLQSRVLENPSFRGYLEYEPQVRKSISLFVNGRYSHCLESLEPLRPDLLLDLHMQRHVDTILNMVRSKCIVQYFAPFSCVTIKTLEKEFAPRDKSIDQELAEMIQEERLDARIDAKDRVWFSYPLWIYFVLWELSLTNHPSFWSLCVPISVRHFRRTRSTLRADTKKKPRRACDASTSSWLALMLLLPRSTIRLMNGMI